MLMQAVLTIEGRKARIALGGIFTFESHREFKEATMTVLGRETVREIEIDFNAVEYIDSAALGMLLLLNERAAGRKIVLCNCRGTVRPVLDVASFDKIFEIR
jgi:anti-anti-sigma factor